ncbi:MFS transporter [Thermogymnomonas acidicola]|uniref:MFS transporter n=1 Tax=Thermogymnomonas acidicola TaxID=399579 RepID=UPI0009468682|nr:MFS transporter [Thermogymnomonas acidicola]
MGSLFSYIGGRISDRFGRKRVAIVGGNSLIPILSFTGLVRSVPGAVATFASGWWSRNFRSPARRALLASAAGPEDRSRAFAFLHSLDVGGGMIATVLVILLLLIRLPLYEIFLFTVPPLVISTLLLVPVRDSGRQAEGGPARRANT